MFDINEEHDPWKCFRVPQPVFPFCLQTTHLLANIHLGAQSVAQQGKQRLQSAFMSRCRFQLLNQASNQQTVFTIVLTALENPCLDTKHHYSTNPAPGESERAEPSQERRSAKHFFPFPIHSHQSPQTSLVQPYPPFPLNRPPSPRFLPFFQPFLTPPPNFSVSHKI